MRTIAAFRSRQKLGKYRIERRLADGGFAAVYQALDTIEGIRVALKVPHTAAMDSSVMDDFRKEVRLTAKLDNPHILPIKNASFIDGHFVIAFPLGVQSLADRLRSRMSLRTTLDFAGQMLDAVAYAHRQRIIHCDIKPENFIVFPGNRLRLTDFGIAKIALRTVRASGSGTIGFIAPEQAMGKPSLRSDVFSLGLILYRMFSGNLPEWPFHWPPEGYSRLRRRVHPELITILRKAIEVVPRRRFRDADQMRVAFERLGPRVLKYAARARRRQTPTTRRRKAKTVRIRK
jgi:serine/threonine-protein kinase